MDHISASFSRENVAAVDAINRKKEDLKRARKLSPSLVQSLEREIEASTAALAKAREASAAYDAERAAVAVAEASRRAALGELNTSHAVDDESVARIVTAAQRTEYVLAARMRRRDEAQSTAQSQYHRAAKETSERNEAHKFSERLAGMAIDAAVDERSFEKRPAVIAWLRVVLEPTARTYFASAVAAREGNRSYKPPGVEALDGALASYWSYVERLTSEAKRAAAELAALEG